MRCGDFWRHSVSSRIDASSNRRAKRSRNGLAIPRGFAALGKRRWGAAVAKRKAAPGVPEAVRAYLAAAGRKGGAARWQGVDAAARRAFAQRIGRLGGRPRKVRAPEDQPRASGVAETRQTS